MNRNSHYNGDFFDGITQTSRDSAQQIVPLIVTLLQPRSVVDIGCGPGLWLATFRQYGIHDILGIDGPWVQPDRLQIPRECFRSVDLGATDFKSDRRFDLAISLETAEHLPPQRADAFVEAMTSFAPVVVFSAAIPFQGGTSHLNEQWPDYWVERFRRRGYEPIDCIRPRVWNDHKVAWWYAQNTLLFATAQSIARNERLQTETAASPQSPLALVHPGLYQQVVTDFHNSLRRSGTRRWFHAASAGYSALRRYLTGDSARPHSSRVSVGQGR